MATATMDVKSTECGWKLAKISKHGYTNFEKEQDCTRAILFLRDNGIVLKGGKEFYIEADTKDYIIEPNKTNTKKIIALVEKVYNIKPY